MKADQTMTITPSVIPKCDIAEGIASVPAPITVRGHIISVFNELIVASGGTSHVYFTYLC